MKNNNLLKLKLLKPKKQTIDFLLNYSKSIKVLSTATNKSFVIMKN
ncbi:hypothetical protein BPO_1881 [Bergeyella porcorum]|uniref:Uncharacterized protein n=1 Tax=Bergeyella porcorum TaxID=1735111 RepID=A0AAU0F4H7_9FLAO